MRLSRIRIGSVASGGTAYQGVLTPQNVTVTQQTATLKLGFKGVLQAQSVTITPQTLALVAGSSVAFQGVMSPQNVSVTQQLGALKTGYKANLLNQDVSITQQNLGLTVGYQSSLINQNVSVTAQTLTAKYGYNAQANAQNVTITAQTGILVTGTVGAFQGVMSPQLINVAAQPCVLKVGNKLVADAQSNAVTQQTLKASYGYASTALNQASTITQQIAVLKLGVKAIMQAQSIAVTQQIGVLGLGGGTVTLEDLQAQITDLKATLTTFASNFVFTKANELDVNIKSVTETSVVDVNDFKGSGGSATVDIPAIVDAVWNDNNTLRSTVGSAGKKLLDGTTGVVTVDNSAIALAVESQLADDFSLVNTNIASIPATDLTPVRNDIAALNDFNPSTQKVANVGTVDVTTLNTDMRGTDNANKLPPIAATAIRDEVWSATIRTTTDSNDANIISVNGVNVATIEDFKSTPTVVDNNAIASSVDSVLLDNFNALDSAIASIPTVDMTKVNLIAEILGLDPANPVTISESSYSSTNTNVTITDNGNGSYTLTKT